MFFVPVIMVVPPFAWRYNAAERIFVVLYAVWRLFLVLMAAGLALENRYAGDL